MAAGRNGEVGMIKGWRSGGSGGDNKPGMSIMQLVFPTSIREIMFLKELIFPNKMFSKYFDKQNMIKIRKYFPPYPIHPYFSFHKFKFSKRWHSGALFYRLSDFQIEQNTFGMSRMS